jgi:hypothetical protein
MLIHIALSREAKSCLLLFSAGTSPHPFIGNDRSRHHVFAHNIVTCGWPRRKPESKPGGHGSIRRRHQASAAEGQKRHENDEDNA